MKEKNFNNKCYKILKKVPKGKIVTYRDIAHALHSKGYRAVGNAMNKNIDLNNIHCYRVIRSDGTIGGYSKGAKKKIELLKRTGINVIDGKIDLLKYGYRF